MIFDDPFLGDINSYDINGFSINGLGISAFKLFMVGPYDGAQLAPVGSFTPDDDACCNTITVSASGSSAGSVARVPGGVSWPQ